MTATEHDVLTRDRVPVAETWDLSGIFANVDSFRDAIGAVDPALDAVLAWQGRLGESAEGLRTALDASYALQLLVERINVFARLVHDQDTTDADALAMSDEATGVSVRVSQSLAWFEPEILTIPEATLETLLGDESLAPYRHAIDDIVRNRQYTQTPEIEELLAMASDIGRTARESFGALDNADLEYGQTPDSDGNLITLTKGRFQLLQESRDRAVRRQAYETFVEAYQRHKYTLAALHAGTVRKDVFYAKARGFASARHMALHANAIDEQVYDTLIEVTRRHSDTVARYGELRRRLLGVDQLEMYDRLVPLAELPVVNYSWAEAVDIVCDGLAVLGDVYVSTMREGLTSARWVDVQETKGKRSGAYSWGAYGAHPVILMNWNGTLSDVFTLAHEAGHAMHSYMSDRALPYQDAQYPIFLAEIASTLNEVLLTWHLLGQIPESEPMARFAILNRFADQILGTHVRQTMFAEFERETHRIVEASEPLTLQRLNSLYAELLRVYDPATRVDERAEINWARIPHFYTGFYVYQYATGISAGIALAKQVRDEGKPAVDRVLRLFSSGGKDYPLPLLSEAGVDLTRPDAIEACMAVLGETISEMQAIVDSGAFSKVTP